jgi:hypothetical protein
MAPTFPGCQPCQYTSNNQTLQPDADQVNKGFALIGSSMRRSNNRRFAAPRRSI